MPDDYYDEGSDTMTAEPSKPTESKDDEAQPQSALVPKSFFAGKENLEVGDTEVVKVLRLMDDEVEIECVKENYDEEKTKEKEPVLESDEMME